MNLFTCDERCLSNSCHISNCSSPSILLHTGYLTPVRLLKEVTSYEKEAKDASAVIEKVKGTEGKDEYDIRQAVSQILLLKVSCRDIEPSLT